MSARRPKVRTYERAPGKWSVIWRELGRQLEERGYETEDEAEDRADEIRQRLRTGLPGARQHRTIGQLVANWYDDYVTTDSVQAATRQGYRIDMARILDTLRDENAHTIGSARVREWRDTIAAQHGPRAANKAHTALSSAYQRGIEASPPMVEHNPCRGVKRLAEPKQGYVAPSRLHVEYLEQTAPAPRELAMLLVASRCGLRQSELFGLKWGQVRGAALQVTQVADPVTRETRQSLKTMRSERRIPMPTRTIAALDAIRPPSASPDDLVFPSPTDPSRPMSRSAWPKTYFWPWRRAAAWQAAADEHGEDVWGELLDLLWKHLRHHSIARWAAAGATITQVSRWSGDSIATIDKHYAYLFDEDEAVVMLAID
jgi:integrase